MISAYLDPASGSAIISAVVAGTAGAGVAARTMLTKMRLKKRNLEPVADGSDSTDTPADETVDEPTQ